MTHKMSTINLPCAVLVGNLPHDSSEEQLKDIFSKIGPVVSFRIFYDKESGKPKGYGICEYQSHEMTSSAVRTFNGYDLKGRILRVDITTSERAREELKNLQLSTGGLFGEDSCDPETEPEKAPEAISRAVASLPPEQMFELMKQMKMCIQNNPNEARNLLLQNPQLAYALLQAQVVMRIVDPQVAINILNRPNPNPNAANSSTPSFESESTKTSATTTAAPTSSGPVSGSRSDSSTNAALTANATPVSSVASQLLSNASVNEEVRSSVPHPQTQMSDTPTLTLAPQVSRPSIPTSRHHQQRGMDGFGSFGDPRTLADRDMRISLQADLGDMRLPSRIDQDMRQPPPMSLGDQDMRHSMGDQDFRIMRGPQVTESHSRPYDPRLRTVVGGDNLGRPGFGPLLYDHHGPHPYDPRTAHESRLSGPPPRLEDPRTTRLQANPRSGPTTSAASALSQALPSIGSSRLSSNMIATATAMAPHDQEKAALIMQVLQLSDDQIAMLPPGQRQSIMILKEQIARSCPP